MEANGASRSVRFTLVAKAPTTHRFEQLEPNTRQERDDEVRN